MECRCSAGACCQDPILCVLGHVWSRVLASGKSPANDGGTQLRPNSDLVFDSRSSSISATSCASARSAIKKTHTSDSQEIQKKKRSKPIWKSHHRVTCTVPYSSSSTLPDKALSETAAKMVLFRGAECTLVCTLVWPGLRAQSGQNRPPKIYNNILRKFARLSEASLFHSHFLFRRQEKTVSKKKTGKNMGHS